MESIIRFQKTEEKKYDTHSLFVLILLAMVLCLCGCRAEPAADSGMENEPVPAETETVKETEPAVSEEERIENVYREGLASTFCIFTPDGNNGAGFLYKDKYVITNAHVLYEAQDFTLMDAEGSEYKGSVVFSDDGLDLAIILVEGCQGRSVVLGEAESVADGDTLVLIGNPSGGEPFASCTGKRLARDGQLSEIINIEERYIPTDAPIVSGYSGGPAFNLSGEVIGINNAAYTGDLSAYDLDHLSLLISIDSVREVIEENCPE